MPLRRYPHAAHTKPARLRINPHNTQIIRDHKKHLKAVKGTTTHSHHDHRIAMACAVAGLKATGDTIIEEADAINKSYPNFYEHIKKLGAIVAELSATKP